ncbi:hypothetical protein BH09ACT3_BH09ACT3_07240 [soil metagenome]
MVAAEPDVRESTRPDYGPITATSGHPLRTTRIMSVLPLAQSSFPFSNTLLFGCRAAAAIDGQLRHLPGGIDEYLQIRAGLESKGATVQESRRSTESNADAGTKSKGQPELYSRSPSPASASSRERRRRLAASNSSTWRAPTRFTPASSSSITRRTITRSSSL